MGESLSVIHIWVNFAKAAAYGLGVPLIPVHHVRGHIAANYITHPELEPPFVCLCVSGGNTMLVDVRDYTDMAILGATRDLSLIHILAFLTLEVRAGNAPAIALYEKLGFREVGRRKKMCIRDRAEPM